MRFLRLDLRAFGPFADAPPLPFDGGPGLHLIHGPNEAGKSSALRAIRCLLFGFPARTGDDHRHAYKDLRVGATIRAADGAELAFLRRKGDLRTIRTPDDDEVIPDEALARLLGGVDRAKFDDLFAMDHAELVAGGLAILQGKGSLGPVLFAAGSGLARVDEVRKALEAEVDGLFKPRASNPAINAALADLKARRDEAERAMLATSSWVDLDATLARERARKDAIDAEIRAVEAEKRRLERLRAALPVIARRAVALDGLADLGDAPALAEGFADRRREATIARQVGARNGLAAGKALEAADLQLDALGPRDAVLDEADAIRRARDELGVYRKALEGRPAEQSRLARKEAEALALLAELRPGVHSTGDDPHPGPLPEGEGGSNGGVRASSSPLPPGEGSGVRGVASVTVRKTGSDVPHSPGDDPHPGPLSGGEGGGIGPDGRSNGAREAVDPALSRLPAGLKEQVQALAQESAGLDARCSAAEAEVTRLSTGPGIGHPSPGPDAARLARALADAVARAQGEGDLEAQLAAGRLDLAKAERQAEVDLRALPLWSGPLDDLEALKAPSAATIDRFEAESRALDEKLARARDALAAVEADLAAIDREIDRERLAGPVPTEEDLADRRGRRDRDWRLIRRGWLDAAPVADPSGLADGFEAAVRSADDVADRLRIEADAVAAQAQRTLRRRELLARVAALADAVDRADRDRADALRSWADLWRPTGLDPLPPPRDEGLGRDPPGRPRPTGQGAPRPPGRPRPPRGSGRGDQGRVGRPSGRAGRAR